MLNPSTYYQFPQPFSDIVHKLHTSVNPLSELALILTALNLSLNSFPDSDLAVEHIQVILEGFPIVLFNPSLLASVLHTGPHNITCRWLRY